MKFLKYTPHLFVFSLAFVLAIVFSPSWLTKHRAELLTGQGKLLAEGQKFFYVDMDGDGNSEEFIYYHLSDNMQPVISQYSAEGEFQHIWYLHGRVVDQFDFLHGDYNSDGKNEIYLFSVDQNGLYLHGMESGQSNTFLLEKILIAPLNGLNKENHIFIRPAGLYDLNNDGFKEAVFSVSNQYNSSPRKLYTYDIHNNVVRSSPEIGLQIIGKPILFDSDNDNSLEIHLSTLNSINYSSTSSQTVSLRSKSIVLDSNLNIKYNPYEYTARMAVSSTFPYQNESFSGHISLNWSLANSMEAKLALISKNGEVLKELILDKESFVFDQSRNDWSEIIIFSNNGTISFYNEQLELVKILKIAGNINQISFVDINKNGEQELLIVKDNSLEIFESDYSSSQEVNIPGIGAQKLLISIKQNVDGSNQLSVQNKVFQYLVNYYEYSYYWGRHFYYFGIALLALLAFILLKYLFNRYIDHVKKKERESTYVHIDLVKNQLDPHFLFNALNSIAYSVNKDDRMTAYRNIGIFSKFMREAIVSINEYGRSLEDELNFVKYYLELEKYRFKDKFDYDIILSPLVCKSCKIPKMCIFSYVESALKKGVLPKETKGRIEIKVDVTENDELVICISDDGLHRSLSFEKGDTKSMKVMERSIKFYNKMNVSPINVNYKDKGTIDKPRGSIVEIQIPIDYSYNEQE